MIPGIGISSALNKPADPVGKIILSGSGPGYIKSVDGGTTFTYGNLPAEQIGMHVSSSYTGQYMFDTQYPKVSSDYGVTWTITQGLVPYLGNLQAGAVSYSGQYMIAVVFSGSVWSSSNYGSTWTEWAAPSYWSSVIWCNRLSSSSSTAIAVDSTNTLRTTNSGSTWSTVNSSVSMFSLFNAGDVYYTYGLGYDGANSYLYLSYDYGTNWSLKYTFTGRNAARGASSANGSYITVVFVKDATHTRDNIAYSTNGGTSFTFKTVDEDFSGRGVYVTSDGTTTQLASNILTGTVFKTTDGWSTYSKTVVSSSVIISLSSHFNTNNIVVVAGDNTFKYTTDFSTYNIPTIIYPLASFDNANVSENTSVMTLTSGSASVGYCKVSVDKGVTWVKGGGSFLASSATGQYMLGALSTSSLNVSSNYGATALSKSTYTSYSKFFVSYSGVFMAAIDSANFHRSLDYGVTWGNTAVGITPERFVASDTPLYALCTSVSYSSAYIRRSANINGATPTWANVGTSIGRSGLSASKTMQYCLSTITSAAIYIQVSADYGATWSNTTVAAGASVVRRFPFVSADGTIMYHFEGNTTGSLFKSTNYGVTWTSIYTTASSISNVSYSRTGKTVILTVSTTSLLISTNFAVSFASKTLTTAMTSSNIDIES